MIIRSQDKKGFVNLENIDTVCMNDEFDIYAFNGTSKSFIGEYSTEEKAIKVLDMICKAYKDFCDYSDIKNNRLFKMPQDSEV